LPLWNLVLAGHQSSGKTLVARRLVQDRGDFVRTRPYPVCELIKLEAQGYNLGVANSEFNQIAPLEAMLDIANYCLQIDNLKDDGVTETATCKRLQESRRTVRPESYRGT